MALITSPVPLNDCRNGWERMGIHGNAWELTRNGFSRKLKVVIDKFVTNPKNCRRTRQDTCKCVKTRASISAPSEERVCNTTPPQLCVWGPHLGILNALVRKASRVTESKQIRGQSFGLASLCYQVVWSIQRTMFIVAGIVFELIMESSRRTFSY